MMQHTESAEFTTIPPLLLQLFTRSDVAAVGIGTSSAGAFTLSLSNTPSNTGSNIGFRCASDPVAISQSFSSSSGRAGGGDTITIGSISDGKIYQSVNVGDTSTYDFSVYVYDLTGTEGEEIASADAQ